DKPGGEFHAELDVTRRLAGELDETAVIVSVGSGSVTDSAKYARHLHAEQTGRRIPFISFPTAASVTAYTSALAALSVGGVKRTLPTAPPDVIICDLRTLADAPLLMTQAGFADVLARSVSYGDWYLAAQLGMDDGFSLVPGKLLEASEVAMLEQAAAVKTADLPAIRTVTDALLLSGMAMSIVNQTAPLSGWEHTISHFLDLTALHQHRPAALHGGQVGVATLVSARAYERAWNALDLDRLTAETDEQQCRATIERVFRQFGADDETIAELWRDAAKKLARRRTTGETRRRFIADKRAGKHDSFVKRAVRSASEVENLLRQAGAPASFDKLDVPPPPAAAHAAVRYAHLVRARFTIGDLLDETAWLSNAAVDALMR
ncbi:MAG: iron-containing alcohol dehydrogenase, partial [Phycisphaerae bacterium]|nr:iron-containing alcohol dehydrogenase [Phycisphaerae bacterium]